MAQDGENRAEGEMMARNSEEKVAVKMTDSGVGEERSTAT